MVGGDSLDAARADAGARKTSPDDGALPHSADPVIALSAKAGLGVTAGGAVQLSNGETIGLMSGADTQFVAGGALRMHSGQAIGVLGGAVAAGEGGLGVQMIAAKDAVDIQAQADVLKVQARDEVTVVSASSFVDFAAAKSISLSTAGGANITIDGGNITVQCPGKISVKAGKKSFGGGSRTNFSLPVMPVSVLALAPQRRLESTFAYDQLTSLAKKFTKLEFVTLLVPIFGYDIPARTYIKLYEGLRNGAIKAPKIKLMNGGHFPASFDNKTREILVHQAAADRAAKNRDESWELVTALLHEFGHYIDIILRKDLADKNADGSSTLNDDADLDEGAKYAYEIAFYDFGGTTETVFAEYVSPTFSGPLKVHYNEIRRAIRQGQDAEAQRNEGKAGSLEFFSAGLGKDYKKRPHSSFGHQSIELALLDADELFRKPDVLRHIYFGNWLRDHSQAVDPALVRKPGAVRDFPRVFSRSELTQIVNIKAELDFVEKPNERQLFLVSEKLLGVYRPLEHIDNPTSFDKSSPDPTTIDKDFQPRATAEYTAVDLTKGVKKYILASQEFMKSEISKAVACGPTIAGYRHFGAALHVLEDYFAHSNFVELSLIKIGHTKVLQWTSRVAGCKFSLPVVTGMFDKDDVIASTAEMFADLLFKVQWEYEEVKPGERTRADRLVLILLRGHGDPDMLKTYENFLHYRDVMSSIPGYTMAGKAMHYSFGLIGNIYNFVYSTLLKVVGDSIDDQQVIRVGNPNTSGSTDPTHSQLAKDHDNHPFHIIAAELAKHAVQTVGHALAARWDGNATINPADVAGSFIIHPAESSWQDNIVKSWALANPKKVKRGESATEWEALEKAHRKQATDAIKEMSASSRKAWTYLDENFGELRK